MMIAFVHIAADLSGAAEPLRPGPALVCAGARARPQRAHAAALRQPGRLRAVAHAATRTLIPHNDLLSDLVLQNVVWKEHIRRTLADGQIPLWNPQIFTGMPFLAGGQASTFYPLNILFYLLPLELAYGWFTALQMALGRRRHVLFTLACCACACPPRCFGGSRLHVQRLPDRQRRLHHVYGRVPGCRFCWPFIEVIIRKQEAKGNPVFQPDSLRCRWAQWPSALTVLAGHPGTDLLHADGGGRL